MNIETKKKLITLGLSDLVEAIENQENDTSLIGKSFSERIEILSEEISSIRYNKLVAKLITNASFKYSSANINSVDSELRGIEKDIIMNLGELGFINTATNIMIVGPTGSGKTYLGCALGVEACKNTYRTFYIRMQDLTRKIDDYSSSPKQLKLFLKRLANYKLLIIDEWLTNKPSDRDIKFIYELMDLRSDIFPTILITQYDIDTWHDRLSGGQHADSIMDRLLSNHYEVPSSENNIRKILGKEKAESFSKSLTK